jgi:branched-chain amino acid transport system permease protein
MAAIVDGILASPPVVCFALAYGIIYGLLGIMDLTLAVRFSTGGLLAWAFSHALGEANPPSLSGELWLVALGGAMVVGQGSWWALCRLRSSDGLAMLVGSFGFLQIFEVALQVIFGTSPHVFRGHPVQQGTPILGSTATQLDFLAVGYALASILAVAWILHRTKFGHRLQVVAAGADLARTVFNLQPTRLEWHAVCLASAVLGPAGFLHAVGHGATSSSGARFGLLGFVAAIVAGRSRPLGAVFVAFALSVASSVAVRWPWTAQLIALCGCALGLGLGQVERRSVRLLGAVTVLLTLGAAAWLGDAFPGAALPRAWQPLVPWFIAALALLWRPLGVLRRAAEREA